MLGTMSSDDEDFDTPLVANSDLFDAEVDSDPDEVTRTSKYGGEIQPPSPTVEEERFNNEDRDNDLDALRQLSDGEEEIAEEMPKKSKKNREPKKRKAKKAAVQKMHSETQRLIREANTRLPYHQPPTKDITHFLKRVPKINILTKRSNEPSIKTTPTIEKTEEAIVPQVNDVDGQIMQTDGVSPEKDTVVKPQLSTPSDMFFLEEPQKQQPPGVNHLLQRFLKHTEGKPKQQKVEVISIEEPDSKHGETIIENGDSQREVADNKQAVKVIKPPKITAGVKLFSLKEKLEANMKLQRAKIREIHESQRKLDNEEISEEEEEEDFEDEDDEDSDFEVDKWNEKNEFEQERNRMADAEQDDNDNTENDSTVEEDARGMQSHDESTSNSTDIRHNKPDGTSRGHIYSDEKTMDLFSSDTNQTADVPDEDDTNDSHESIRLRLDGLEDTQDGMTSVTSYTKVKSPQTFKEQSSDGSLSHIQAAQGTPWNMDTRKQETTTTDGFTPFSTIQKLLGVNCSSESTKTKAPRPISELTLPVEDSQDLYDDDGNDSGTIRNAQNTGLSQDFHFALDEDTQFTQFVDTQGFLLSTSKKKNAPSVPENETEDKNNMNELLGLCSGTFSDTPKDNPKKQNDSNQEDNNMTELLGLCSGKFPDNNKQSGKDSGFTFKKGSSFRIESEDDKNKDMTELLGLCSGRFTGVSSHAKDGRKEGEQSLESKESGIFSNLEETTIAKTKSRSKQGLSAMFDAMADENDASEPNIDDAVALCSGKFPTTQKSSNVGNLDEPEDDLQDDLEDDQENDDSSDEEVFSENEEDNLDADEDNSDMDKLRKSKKYAISYGNKNKRIFDKHNFLEEEAELSGSEVSSDEEENCGDDEFEEDSDVEDLPSDEELMRQVNKVHMKTLYDDDQRDLRAFKERYLEDGDLYSEGRGRSRNFKWQGLSDSQMDLFENKVLWGDEEVVDSELLSQEELDRRKMKHEREQFLQEQIQHDSAESEHVDENSQNILNLIKDTSNAAADVKKAFVKPIPKPQEPKSAKLPQRRGSFLNRSKDQLSRLSSITAVKKTPVSTRGFVFQTVSPSSKNMKSKKPQRSASLSEPPNPKRPRLERTLSSAPIATGSLFAMM